MSRDNSTYKTSYNAALDLIKGLGPNDDLPTEIALAKTWSTSRTTVRAVLKGLSENGVIEWQGRRKAILRAPARRDYFPVVETESAHDRVRSMFMQYILGGDLHSGAILRESDLAREFGVSTSVVREFLIDFSRFGLIEKQRNRHWVLLGFTREFAEELFDVREMFERRAFELFLNAVADGDPCEELLALRPAHERLSKDIEEKYLEFPPLDARFHRIWVERQGNRFVTDFFDLVALIFHYHYRWDKDDEKVRNLNAIHQHLEIIAAVELCDRRRALDAFSNHLEHARGTLMSSVRWP